MTPLVTSVTAIEEAVAALPAEDFATFREWFARFEADRFDSRFAADVAGGRLDALADEALSDLRSGNVRAI